MKDWKTILHEKNLRATPARLQILSILEAQNAPLTIDEIRNQLVKACDYSTVFRCLTTFQKHKLISKRYLAPKTAYYELNIAEHHHLVCGICHQIEELDFCPFAQIETEILARSTLFDKLEHGQLDLKGICVKCAHR